MMKHNIVINMYHIVEKMLLTHFRHKRFIMNTVIFTRLVDKTVLLTLKIRLQEVQF